MHFHRRAGLLCPSVLPLLSVVNKKDEIFLKVIRWVLEENIPYAITLSPLECTHDTKFFKQKNE